MEKTNMASPPQLDLLIEMLGDSKEPKLSDGMISDVILPRKGPVTRAMSKRLQEDWARAVEEGPRILMSLRVDFGLMG